MANASFTRDEVILALDVLYCSGETRLNASSQEIVDLCTLLRKLPIIPAVYVPDGKRSQQPICTIQAQL